MTLHVAGIKFIVFTDPSRSSEELLLKKLYEIYADFALKNPFYSLDMPIRYGTDCLLYLFVSL